MASCMAGSRKASGRPCSRRRCTTTPVSCVPAAFDYVVPRTLPEAVAELVKRGQEAKVLAGGHSLIPLMKLRLSTPSFLVDIGRINNLNYIREEDGHVAIGALTTHHDIEFSD